MKRLGVVIGLMLLAVLPVRGQEFIGCRVGEGWAETPIVKKTFTLTEEEAGKTGDDDRAVSFYVEVTSMGYHQVFLNGRRIGDRVMQPAVSQLNKRLLTVTYDITEYIRPGENEIMIWIGQGWGRIYGTPAAVMAEVKREEAVLGSVIESEVTSSVGTWKASPSGYSYTGSWQPMQFGGERFDARVQPQWSSADILEVDYDTVETMNGEVLVSRTKVSPQEFSGNRVVDTIQRESLSLLDWDKDSAIVVGFDKVVTGWFAVQFKALDSGTVVTMEYLDHYDAKPPHTETDVYIARGSGQEAFINRFHTHSFKYVRIKGAGKSIEGCCALQISAVDPHGGATFECSDGRLNAIHDMIKYTLSCLTFSGYMVDCPHIERMGYGGDGNSSTMTLQTLWDVRDTYRNWMTAWGDAMEPDGELPYVAPSFRTGGGPYWSSFIVKAPWRTYLNYGDKYLMTRHYGQMKKWLEYVEKHSDDEILQPWPDNERHSWFLGDWLAPEGVDIGGESVLHVSSCVVSECLGDMEKMAHLTGHDNDARQFAQRRSRLNAAIHRHFYHPESHTYGNGTPLDQAYALLLGIPPDEETRQAVREQLLKDCHGKYRDHIAAGLMGVPVFTEWCIKERQADLMATILRQPDYPGYLNMINQGATTTWESWDCGREGKEDRSRVHNCYNGVGIWFYQALAGLRPDPEEPGYKHFYVDPQRVEGVEWVKVSKPTQYGEIKVAIEGKRLKVRVPEGATATVFPGTKREKTVEAGEWSFKIKQ